MNFWSVVGPALPALTKGIELTIILAIASVIPATILGFIVGLLRMSRLKVLQTLASIYITVVRGTPLLVMVLFAAFALPQVLPFKLPRIVEGILALVIHNSAYLAEIFRAGLESVSKEQNEAGRSLGLTRGQTLRFVIFPQAVRRMIPALVNQFIITVKDTSLLSTIGVAEITLQGQTIYSENFAALQILTVVAAYYVVVVYLMERAARWIEKRMILT